MKKLLSFSIEEIEQADNEMQGFCIVCGHLQDGCEPDARKYQCDECGERRVYGAAELAIMGLVY
jgi:hypothetical protein